MRKVFFALIACVSFWSCSTSPNNNGGTNTTIIPIAPSNLTGVVVSNTRVNLSWTDNSTNETGFKRVGLDLILEKNISLKESLCGFIFEINYINGKSYTLNNNKGNIIPPEYKKIYQGMGLTRGEHKGNMIIHFHVDFPEKLSEEQIIKLSEAL